MAYEFKKLSDVAVVETPAETANVLIEEDGIIKKVAKTAVGDKGGINIVSAAEVGQTIVVKAVDENGNPTEWECIDLPEAAVDPVVVLTPQNLIIDGETCPTEFAVNSEDTIYLKNAEWYYKLLEACNANARFILKEDGLMKTGVGITTSGDIISIHFEGYLFQVWA